MTDRREGQAGPRARAKGSKQEETCPSRKIPAQNWPIIPADKLPGELS